MDQGVRTGLSSPPIGGSRLRRGGGRHARTSWRHPHHRADRGRMWWVDRAGSQPDQHRRRDGRGDAGGRGAEDDGGARHLSRRRPPEDPRGRREEGGQARLVHVPRGRGDRPACRGIQGEVPVPAGRCLPRDGERAPHEGDAGAAGGAAELRRHRVADHGDPAPLRGWPHDAVLLTEHEAHPRRLQDEGHGRARPERDRSVLAHLVRLQHEPHPGERGAEDARRPHEPRPGGQARRDGHEHRPAVGRLGPVHAGHRQGQAVADRLRHEAEGVGPAGLGAGAPRPHREGRGRGVTDDIQGPRRPRGAREEGPGEVGAARAGRREHRPGGHGAEGQEPERRPALHRLPPRVRRPEGLPRQPVRGGRRQARLQGLGPGARQDDGPDREGHEALERYLQGHVPVGAAGVGAPAGGGRWRLPALRAEHWLFAASLVALLWIVVPPMLALARASVMVGERPGRAGRLSLEAYAEILGSSDLLELVVTTVAFAAGSTIVGLILGGTLAWCVERTNAPLRQLAYPAIFVSFAVPGIVRAIGWIFLLGPRTGTINEIFRAITGSEGVLLDVFSLPAMILVEGVFWIPLVFLMMAASFRSMDPSLEEASLVSGAATWRTIRRITAALALPSVLSVLILTFIRSVQAFEVPLLLGVPGKSYTVTTEVYLSVNSTIVPEYAYSSAYGVLLVAFLIAGIALYGRATRRASSFATITGKGFRPRVLDLGRGRWVVTAIVLAILSLQFLPIIWVTVASFLPTI